MQSSRFAFSSLQTQHGFTFSAAAPGGLRSEARFAEVAEEDDICQHRRDWEDTVGGRRKVQEGDLRDVLGEIGLEGLEATGLDSEAPMMVHCGVENADVEDSL